MKQVFQRLLQFLVISKSQFGNLKKFYWIFPSTLLSFCLIFLYVQQGSGTKTDQIDQQVTLLEKQKGKLKMEIEKERLNAMRWQGQGNSLEVRRAWRDIDAKEKTIQDIDSKIKELQQKKELILQEKQDERKLLK